MLFRIDQDGNDGARYRYVKSETGLKLGNDTTTCTNELKVTKYSMYATLFIHINFAYILFDFHLNYRQMHGSVGL